MANEERAMPKILVVDDEPDVILLCRVNLGFDGYEVLEAADGASALEIATRERPDLILLDVMMPGMDGWQVLSRLRRIPETADIPVVMLTAKVQERDQVRGWTEGAIDYVTKPFSPVALMRTVRNTLDLRSPEDRERHRRRMIDKLKLVQAP
jgi:two-component system alkaline phosphatase synthesis response regulator PhoP